MSCTIFYNGKLKSKYNENDLYQSIISKISETGWSYKIEENCLVIDLMDEKSEELIFGFKEQKMEEFCKVFSEDINVFYQIFDLFLSIKSMFSTLHIDDDLGLYNDYIAKKSPAKIKFYELSEVQMHFIQSYRPEALSSNILYGIIGTDIRENATDKITYQYLIDHVNPKVPSYLHGSHFMDDNAILETWVYETMEYKNYGRVCDLDFNTRGLLSSLEAFSFGISEAVFGNYGGSTGSKQAQIRKLYVEEAINKKIDIEKDHVFFYRFILSVLEYLGFKRVGKKEKHD